MAGTELFRYTPVNYIVQFKWGEKSLLFLGYNKNLKFQFIDLETGKIFSNIFNNPEEAEEWLLSAAQIYAKNEICPTYVP